MKIFFALAFIMFAVCCGSALIGCGDDDDDADDDLTEDDAGIDDDTVEDSSFTAVDIRSETSPAVKLAVQACAGMQNRKRGGSSYIIMKDKDSQWLDELDLNPGKTTDAARYLESCAAEFPCLRYSYDAQQTLLPNILTVGAVLGAIPLDAAMTAQCSNPAFDAISEFEERNTPYLATKYVYENFVADTAGPAMINPGYDAHDEQFWDPALTGDIDASLVDFVFSGKLFAMYLINGCIESTLEGDLLTEIARANPWPSPIGVYGYADYWMVFGGYLFEAQTRCVESRNMGAIATAGVNNLSFFSTRRNPILDANEIERNEPEDIEYDPNTTYAAFVVGDGDNVAYIMDKRSEWLAQRLEDCGRAENSCEPITWTISPHLTRIAPDVLEWYYDMSRQTGKDYFMLPPSGHLYAYPSSMADDVQNEFVAATEQDARILGVNSTIHWDWFTTWQRAETAFLPKYAKDGVIQGVFPVNVPYMIPVFTGWEADQRFKVLDGPDGGEVVLFRPREWRGIDDSGSGLTTEFYLSPEKMAEELSQYPRGAVTYVYMTSDGGLTLENSFMALVKLLPEHVRLVSAETAVRLALEANRKSLNPE